LPCGLGVPSLSKKLGVMFLPELINGLVDNK
jgi:hypothetical protein